MSDAIIKIGEPKQARVKGVLALEECDHPALMVPAVKVVNVEVVGTLEITSTPYFLTLDQFNKK